MVLENKIKKIDSMEGSENYQQKVDIELIKQGIKIIEKDVDDIKARLLPISEYVIGQKVYEKKFNIYLPIFYTVASAIAGFLGAHLPHVQGWFR